MAHYLAARLWEPAARAMERAGRDYLQHGLLDTVGCRIRDLPAPVRQEHPRLAYLEGAIAAQRGQIGPARQLLQRAEEAFQSRGDRPWQGEALAQLAWCAMLDADLVEGMALTERALALPLPPPTRAQLLIAVETQLAFLALFRGRLDDVLTHGRRTLETSRRLDHLSPMEPDAAMVQGLAHQARGDFAQAERCFQLGFEYIQRLPLHRDVVLPGYLYVLGRARYLQGRLDEAREIASRICARGGPAQAPLSEPMCAMMRGLIHLAEGRHAAAERLLRRAEALVEAVPHAALFTRPAFWLARLYLQWERPRTALAELEPLMAECEREGTPGYVLNEGSAAIPVLRLAVDRGLRAGFARRLLRLLEEGRAPRPLTVPDTGETLTPREMEVLRLLAQGGSNRGIAERLAISPLTVKSHVYRIFGKLGVTNRTRAAARARERHIV